MSSGGNRGLDEVLVNEELTFANSTAALNEFRQRLQELTDDVIFDLGNLSNENFGFNENEVIPMIDQNQPETFNPERLLQHSVSQFRRNEVGFKKAVWQRILDFHDKFVKNNQYEQRHGHGQVGQLFVEVLSIFSQLNPNELYQRHYGEEYEPRFRHARDALVGKAIRKLLKPFKDPNFKFELNDPMLTDIIRPFLASETVFKSIRAAAEYCFDTTQLTRITAEFVRELAFSVNVYSCEKSLGKMAGVNVRDGFALCMHCLSGWKGTDKYRCFLFTLSLHEFSHHVLRKASGNFAFKSPVSKIEENFGFNENCPDRGPPEKIPRMDMRDVMKPLEFGRAVEISMFGGVPDGLEPDWDRSSDTAATNFLERLQTGNYPVYESRKECEADGFVETRYPCLSFAAKLQPSYHVNIK